MSEARIAKLVFMKSWHSHWTILPSQQCFLFTVIVVNRRPVVSLCIRFSSDLIDDDGLIIGQSIQFFVAPAMVKKKRLNISRRFFHGHSMLTRRL
jgi:hypothetical protein